MPPQNSTSEPPAPPLRLRLPATSANLGPGFDTLGLALSLYLTIDARQASEFHIEATGRDPDLCGSLSNNLILMTYEEVFRDLGLAAPSLALKLHNEIPLGMGCGSSAAAILAGVFLANHFGQLQWSAQEILDAASAQEGHPDNVAACFHGGMTASATVATASVEPQPTTITATFGRDLNWKLLLALPAGRLPTSKARALLPNSYSRADAVANLQSTAVLVSAFALNRPELLAVAMRDRIHQPFRSSSCPLLPALLPLAGHGGICGVCLSGAGPAVLLIASPDAQLSKVHSSVQQAAGDLISELLHLSFGQACAVTM